MKNPTEGNSRQVSTAVTAGRVLAIVCMAATFLLGLPFAGHGALNWEEMGDRVVAGTLLTTAVSFSHATASTSFRDALFLLLLTIGISWFAEASGVCWGAPFGCSYQYNDALRPFLWGQVPLIIPAAWYALLRLPLILMAGWKIQRKANGRPEAIPMHLKAAACGSYMAGCGLLLDPLGAVLGAWKWSNPEGFMAVQVENALGWMIIGYLVSASYLWFQRPPSRPAPSWLLRLDRDIVSVSMGFYMLAMMTISSRVHTWLPALVSIAVMMPVWLIWIHNRSVRTGVGG